MKRRNSHPDVRPSSSKVTKPLPDWDEATGKSIPDKVRALLHPQGNERKQRDKAAKLVLDFVSSKSFGAAGGDRAKQNTVEALCLLLAIPWKNGEHYEERMTCDREVYKSALESVLEVLGSIHNQKRKLLDLDDVLKLFDAFKGQWDVGAVERVSYRTLMRIPMDLYTVAVHLPAKHTEEQLQRLFDLTWGEWMKMRPDDSRLMASAYYKTFNSKDELSSRMLEVSWIGGRHKDLYVIDDLMNNVQEEDHNAHTCAAMERFMRAGPVWKATTAHIQRKCPCCGEMTPNEFKACPVVEKKR